MLRVVFFDAAGTLFHTREPAGLSYAKIARRFGVEADERLVIDSFRRSFGAAPGLAFGPGHEAAKLRRLEREWWRQLVRAMFASISHFAEFEAYFDALFAFFADPANWIRDPAAEPLLAGLREHGLTLGVISNFDHRIYRILETLELSRYFDSITISSEAGYAQPSPEIFRAALGWHSLPAAEPGQERHGRVAKRGTSRYASKREPLSFDDVGRGGGAARYAPWRHRGRAAADPAAA